MTKNGNTIADLRQKVQVNEKEAAELLSICPQTLAKWRKAGVAPPAFRMGGSFFYPLKALEDWSNKQVEEAV